MSSGKELLEKLMGGGTKKENMIVFVLVGILLFIIFMPVKEQEEKKSVLTDKQSETIEVQTESGFEVADYTAYLENKLEETLAYVEGVGKVEVMVVLSASEKTVVEKDRATNRSNTLEADAEGGTREISNTESTETTLYTVDGQGNQVPYVTQLCEPEIEGVMVVAQGAGRERVNSDISEAIQALFGIEAHKIKIAKMKTE